MKLLITHDAKYEVTPDGKVWTVNSANYDFWKRYLSKFSEVYVLARVSKVCKQKINSTEASGTKVSFVGFPSFKGPLNYLLYHFYFQKKLKETIILNRDAVFIIRSPSIFNVTKFLPDNEVFGVEVVGDPREVFIQTKVYDLLSLFFRYLFTNRQKKICMKAHAVSYVTKNQLQQFYPTNRNAFSISYSSVEIPSQEITVSKTIKKKKIQHIVAVGSLERLYKSPDIFIKALEICHKEGLNFKATWIGTGKYLKSLIEDTERLGLKNKIEFIGALPGNAEVIKYLYKTDLFVLPSRTEGLPRALIEAMAIGMPCIGTNVGGIPELLEVDEMISPENPLALANKIMSILDDVMLQREMSTRNFKKAKEFSSEKLSKKRNDFYSYLIDLKEKMKK